MPIPIKNIYVTCVAHTATIPEGFVDVSYGAPGDAAAGGEFKMFRDWVWGEGKLSFGLSEPADVGVSCDDDFVSA